MDNSVFEKIKSDLPNFPTEVIISWLQPYGEELGWPPVHRRWNGILSGRSLRFWQLVNWERKILDLTTVPFSEEARSGLAGMKKAYLLGEENIYKRELQGEERHMNAVRYMFENGKLPGAVSFLLENGGYSIVDGNHRFLAWMTHRDIVGVMTKVENENTEGHRDRILIFRKTILEKWGIDSIAAFSPEQEVWVATL